MSNIIYDIYREVCYITWRKMKKGDLVYPFWGYGDRTIGIIVETYNDKTSVYNVFVNQKVFVIPKYKLVLAW